MNLIYLFGSYFITGLSLLLLRPVAERFGLVDIPGGRKTHTSATPLIGGIGIFVGVLFISAIVPNVLFEFAPFLISLSALVLFIGTLDDARELPIHVRMTGNSLVALVMALVAGIQLTSLGNLLSFGAIELGLFSIPLTVFATVGVINAINMSDGIDGLSGALVIVSLSFIALITLRNNDTDTAYLAIILACSISAFLSLNFRRPWKLKALIYLGDGGSTMLG